jgi:eukaryotic-like serine/threonine-protein kinase
MPPKDPDPPPSKTQTDSPEYEDPPPLEAESDFRFSGEGEYQIGAEIARGGAGRILVGWDTRLEREVAVKTLLRHDTSRLRLTREALLAAQLEHPGIVPIYAAGRLTNGGSRVRHEANQRAAAA